MQSGIILNSRLKETVKPKCKLEWGVAGDSRNRPLNQLFTTLAHCGYPTQQSEAEIFKLLRAFIVCIFCFYFFSIFSSSLQLLYLAIRHKLLVSIYFVLLVLVFLSYSYVIGHVAINSRKNVFGSQYRIHRSNYCQKLQIFPLQKMIRR